MTDEQLKKGSDLKSRIDRLSVNEIDEEQAAALNEIIEKKRRES